MQKANLSPWREITVSPSIDAPGLGGVGELPLHGLKGNAKTLADLVAGVPIDQHPLARLGIRPDGERITAPILPDVVFQAFPLGPGQGPEKMQELITHNQRLGHTHLPAMTG